MDKENFADRVGIIAGLVGGQAELSRRTGISTVSIGAYVSGRSDPSRERLIAMARAADVSVGWLAAGEGPMRPGIEQDKVNHLEDPIITDLKLWINHLTSQNPDRIAWFRVELEERFKEFKEWREKKQEPAQAENSANG